VPVRDQRWVSRGIYEILESLTRGGFPIRSARGSASAGIGIRVRTLCGNFSKYVTVIQYRAAPLRDQGRKTIPFLASALATQSASSQMTPVSGNARLLALKQTRRLTDLGNQGSPNRRQIVVHSRRMFFPLNLSERHNHPCDRRRSTLYSSDHITRCAR
jgi:hypothetical protein